MSSFRLQRVRELLKRKLGEVIREELPMEQAGLVSVNDVQVSPDLKSASVYVSILGDPDQQRRGLTLLNEQRSRIQTLVGQSVVLKYTPVLRFIQDTSIQRGDRVLQIIEELEREDTPPSDTGD